MQLSEGGARENGKLARSLQPCMLSQGGLESSDYKYLVFVFLKSAYMDSNNRLNEWPHESVVGLDLSVQLKFLSRTCVLYNCVSAV